jgi:hypothetical protein
MLQLTVLLLVTFTRLTTCYLTNVAFRAVSSSLKQSELTTILAGARNIECVMKEARRIKHEFGNAASHEFLNRIPELYSWQSQQLRKILLDTECSINQVVILKAQMNTMAYELPCLRDCDVIEVDDKAIIQVKEHMIAKDASHIKPFSRTLQRISDVQCINWSRRTAVVMPEHYQQIPRQLSKGSAVILHADKLVDVSKFNRVTVRRRDGVVQIAASRYLES